MRRLTCLLAFSLVCSLSCQEQSNANQPKLSPAQVETQVLRLLNAGKQSDAETLLEQYVPVYRKNQRILFLTACCERSRFMIQEAAPVFAAVADLGTNTITGKCALHILYLDAKRDAHTHFEALQQLVEANTNDVMLRWMIAVECRSFNQNEEGVKHYQKLLEQWNPGPVLVHQTYGNLLDELHQYEEALTERRRAVELEPAGWSYQGLGNTLAALNRFSDANTAYAKSVELAPRRSAYWTSWAWSLSREKNFPEAIAKCEKATTLNPDDATAWKQWGYCLELQGKMDEALGKYKKALAIDSADEYTKARIKVVQGQLAVDEKR